MTKSRNLLAMASALVVAFITFSHAADDDLTVADLERMMVDLSNWGRWGADHQLGTLNLITAEKRIQAAGLVKLGVSVSMAQTLLTTPQIDSPSAFEHEMVVTPNDTNPWAVDRLSVVFHGLGHSHIDSLCHHGYKGKYYNDNSVSTITSDGCGTGSVITMADGIFTRAVLMDIPRLKGEKWLEPGTPVFAEDLEAWEQQIGIRVGSGDAVLLRTGRWARREALGAWDPGQGFAGFHASAVAWLKQRDVAIVGTDAGLDVSPSGMEGEGSPVHILVLVALGMPILDAMNLEAVAQKAAELERWEFLLTAAPLKVPTGTGSPLNAIATF